MNSVIRLPTAFAVIASTVLCVPTQLSASVPFDSGQVLVGGLGGPSDVRAADLDGDNVPDVVAVHPAKVVLALNDGDGSSWTTSTLANGSRARQIDLGDLDGDEDLDVIYTDFTEDRVYWIPNNLDTSGSFGGRRVLATVTGADGVFAADIDGDDDIDVVATGRKSDVYLWFENTDGTGTSWTEHIIANRLDAAQQVWVGDLDGDDDPDIVGGGAENNGQLVWFENTAGDGSAWTTTALLDAWINGIEAGDLDYDGDIDIVVQINNAGPDNRDRFAWFENTAGDASAWVERDIGNTNPDASKGIELVDLDFDGDLDIIGARNGNWYENTLGDASIWTTQSFNDSPDITGVDLADVDDDGDLDIIGIRLESRGLELWTNLTCVALDDDDDSDGFRNDCDVCDGFDDALDDDGDGVPNGCDVCPGGDDRVDTDDGGTPDDCQGALTIDDVTASEGDSGTKNFSFTVTLTGDVAGGFTVPFNSVDGTATTADGDYTAASGTLNFAGNDGETQTLTIEAQGDTTVEDDETFTVTLGTPSQSAVTVDDGGGLGTVENDDSATVIIDDVTASEGDSGTTDFTFTVTLTGDVAGGFTVPFDSTDGTATTTDGDYVAASGTLTFAGNDGEIQTLTVEAQGDAVVEDDETFTVTLGTPSQSAVTVDDGSGLGTVENDDSATVAIDDVAANEGSSGTTGFTFTVTLTGDVAGGFTVPFNSVDGTATAADSDYAAASGTLNFAGHDGETQALTVNVQGDTLAETDETFTIELGAPSKASVTSSDGSGLGTVQNDDSATVTIDDVTVNEGDSGTATLTFNASLTGTVVGGFTLGYTTQDGTATATDGDYSTASGTLTFAGNNGEIQTLTVDVQGDAVVEADETFTVELGTPSEAIVTVTDGSGLGTVQNDDSATITIDDVDQFEGNSGSTAYTFTVTLAGDVDGGFTVPFIASDGSATAADGDYIANAGTLTFNGGDGETQTLTVDVQGDGVVENDEFFTVLVGVPSNTSVSAVNGAGLGSVRNDDSASLSIEDVAIAEGDLGTVDFVFTVILTGAVDSAFTVDYSTRDDSAAVDDGDYAVATGTLNFLGVDGETQSITVEVQGDTTEEGNESFFVDLSSISNSLVVLADGTGEGSILGDDVVLPSLIFEDGFESGDTSAWTLFP